LEILAAFRNIRCLCKFGSIKVPEMADMKEEDEEGGGGG